MRVVARVSNQYQRVTLSLCSRSVADRAEDIAPAFGKHGVRARFQFVLQCECVTPGVRRGVLGEQLMTTTTVMTARAVATMRATRMG